MSEYLTYITEEVAIGELNASYAAFDTVVNLAYINPSYNRGLGHRTCRETMRDGKHIFEFGLYDSDSDADYLREILHRHLPNLTHGRNRILFHCQAGKSRSVAVALAFLCLTTGGKVDDVLEIIRDRRPVIQPRPAFIQVVREWVREE